MNRLKNYWVMYNFTKRFKNQNILLITMTNCYTCYEKFNQQKLDEVIQCKNIPYDPFTDDEWYDALNTKLKHYNNLPTLNENTKKITYNQKTRHYGRMTSNLGAQGLQRDIRKYIHGEYYVDIDVVNCHPVLLNQLLQKSGMYSPFLNTFVSDRTETMKRFNIEKQDMFSIMYNENVKTKYANIQEIRQF